MFYRGRKERWRYNRHCQPERAQHISDKRTEGQQCLIKIYVYINYRNERDNIFLTDLNNDGDKSKDRTMTNFYKSGLGTSGCRGIILQPRGKFEGMRNLGNTCYLSSISQVRTYVTTLISNTVPFLSYNWVKSVLWCFIVVGLLQNSRCHMSIEWIIIFLVAERALMVIIREFSTEPSYK